jgi:peptidyl-dipeptidase A
MQAIAGTERMDAGAVLDYYAPLQRWLDRQNQGRSCGW